jgi:general transcription factor 3C polypeptide 3 (transcription factor C subunit 4)
LVETSELARCARLFQDAFEHYQNILPLGYAVDPATGAQIPGGGFNELQILVLADLWNANAQQNRCADGIADGAADGNETESGNAMAAVHAIRKGTRWLQGRANQRFWDACVDDREYDIEGIVTRTGEPQGGGYLLDVNARHRLGIARIKNGDVEEGKASPFYCFYLDLIL